MFRSLACAALTLAFVAGPVAAQPERLVADVARHLERGYIFPDVAARAAAVLRKRQAAGAYRRLEGQALAHALTADLEGVTRDKHLRVTYSGSDLPQADQAPPGDEERARALLMLRRANFGVERAERLDGNIGYLDLRAFAHAGLAGDAIGAAMTLLQHTDALVIDLRNNGGGDPHTVALLASYLIDGVVQLNDMVWREGAQGKGSERTQQFWTSSYLPGPRYGATRPVYLLTSARTFSAAEDFAYALANLKRVTIVGEATGGGAHPGGVVRLDRRFEMFMPTGRSVSPVTGTNWEGVGVQPHIRTASADALTVALERARRGGAGS